MDILLMAPISGFKARDGGYGNSSYGVYTILKKMVEDGIINSVNVYNTMEAPNQEVLKKEYDLGIVFTNPGSLAMDKNITVVNSLLKTCKRKLVNILWETLPLPIFWNKLWTEAGIDGFITSSYFVGSQLTQLTQKPVYYFPIYVDESNYLPIDILEKQEEDIFTVLFVGQNTKRKGVEDSIIAYSRAFEGVKDTQLIVKCYQLSGVELPVETIIQKVSVSNMRCKDAPIFLLADEVPSEEMAKLYRSSSVLLFLSRGEGWGLPAHEAMLCGLPVIFSNWSCLREIANSGANFPVECHLDEAHSMFHYGYEIGSFYGVPSIHESIKALRRAYTLWKSNKNQYYNTTLKNRDYILKNFGKEICIEYWDNIIFEKEAFCPQKYFKSDLMNLCKREWDIIRLKNN